ncbi:hypothetical protein F0562_034461 [Nyssa sinensis]|uniref:Bacterial transcriptional activator domain-containing protein n=1 Tax=Nyssa sinensis TaxID=561372 RepID=A0A5J5AFW4_9ASTE|nr:hypothetical protein F0562_034461 [Nyssa sinensis]
MDSALAIGSALSHCKTLSLTSLKPSLRPPLSLPSNFSFPISKPSHSPCRLRIRVKASSNSNPNGSPNNPIIQKLKTTAGAIVFAAALVVGKFNVLPARADSPPTTEERIGEVDSQEEKTEDSSPLSQFLESNSEAIEALKSLLQQKLEVGEDDEALKILKKLVSAQPEQTEWKFLMGRLEEALAIAEEENKVKEARDVRLIMAQIQFLQKNVEDALMSYDELVKEDPTDFRPYFCKGMIYSLLDRNKEAKEQFAKYRELSPKKFEVEGYLRSPLSRMKLFSANEEN